MSGKRTLAVIVATSLLAVSGCIDLLQLLGLYERESGSAALKRFESENELRDYFTDQIDSENDQQRSSGPVGALAEDELGGSFGADDADTSADAPGAAPQDSGADGSGNDDAGANETSGGSFSETTVQEAGVDEADVVKTDGTYLYIIHLGTLRIVRVSPPEELAVISETELEGTGREIYLHDSRVVALTENGGGYFVYGGDVRAETVNVAIEDVAVEPAANGSGDDEGTEDAGDSGSAGAEGEPDGSDTSSTAPADDDGTEPGDDTSDDVDRGDDASPPYEYRYERPKTIVTILDVSTPATPTQLSRTSFDGGLSSSRMIDGVLHLVLANYQDYYYDILPMFGQEAVDLSAIETKDLLPGYERIDADGNTTSGPVLTWEDVYRPTDPDGFGVVTVVSLDTNTRDANFSATAIVAEPGLIYSSREALYLTDTDWDFWGQTRQTTDVYKLAYEGSKAVPVATGSVPGRVLSQYSMGEYGGYLRVATTVGDEFLWEGTWIESSNNVYVLGEVDGQLSVDGSVEKIAPGETITSARFVGDKGFLVTFEQIDPLFTMDLSDPANPQLIGELKVPGFSTFLVPMDEDHLLAVGEYVSPEGQWWNSGVQLSIFDISDFADPQLQHNVIIGQQMGAYSEALSDPKAFTYFAAEDLVALPIYVYGATPWLEVDGTVTVLDTDEEPVADEPKPATSPGSAEAGDLSSTPQEFQGVIVFRVTVEDGFDELGSIDTQFETDLYSWPWFTRGVFVDDNVFAVTNNGVRGAPVSNIASAPYELVFTVDDELPRDDEPILFEAEPVEGPSGSGE
ncbi:MAG: beta-propeller domain-containing protein [Planctomycetes bacterium]|nr:beta-propeller domain-containing protein [Planctomycetota bacterium]